MKGIIKSILEPLKEIVKSSQNITPDEIKRELAKEYFKSNNSKEDVDSNFSSFQNEVDELRSLWDNYQKLLLSYKKSEEELRKSHKQLKEDNVALQNKLNAVVQEKSQIQTDYDGLNKQFSIASTKIIRTNRIRYAKLDYSRFSASTVSISADETRKKNGKLNYSKIGKRLGVSDHTASNICKHFNIC